MSPRKCPAAGREAETAPRASVVVDRSAPVSRPRTETVVPGRKTAVLVLDGAADRGTRRLRRCHDPGGRHEEYSEDVTAHECRGEKNSSFSAALGTWAGIRRRRVIRCKMGFAGP